MKNSQQRMMRKSDMLFARLMLGGKVIAEGMLSGISDTTELLARVREAGKGYAGLAMLYVRSISRGWQMERPLRLYPRATPCRERMSFTGSRFPWEL